MERCVVLVLLVINLPWDHFSMIWFASGARRLA
jgi:hypothetical protein